MVQAVTLEPQEGGPYTVTFSIRSFLMFVAAMGPLVGLIIFFLQVRQDVRSNSFRIVAAEQEISTLKTRLADVERAKLLFCAARGDSDSLRAGLPNIGC